LADDARADMAAEVAAIAEENARLLHRLERGERRFRVVSRGVVRLQEAQLGRFSRELHDGVGQSLTALKMQLEILLKESAGSASGGLSAPLCRPWRLALKVVVVLARKP